MNQNLFLDFKNVEIKQQKNNDDGKTVNTSSLYSPAATETIVGATPELLDLGGQLGKGAQPTEVQITSIVKKFNEEEEKNTF